jgi:hypothetical protein
MQVLICLFLPFVRGSYNRPYFPLFDRMSQDNFNTFMSKLAVMFGIELLSDLLLFFLFLRVYCVNFFVRGGQVLTRKSFLYCVVLMGIHTSMDPYWSLATVSFH